MATRDYIGPDGLRHISLPYERSPGGIEPAQPKQPVVYVQHSPSTMWIIQHNLGYDPNVTVIINNEEADADVSYPSTSVTVIRFDQPQKGTARLT
jgi:hypothetical protein